MYAERSWEGLLQIGGGRSPSLRARVVVAYVRKRPALEMWSAVPRRKFLKEQLCAAVG